MAASNVKVTITGDAEIAKALRALGPVVARKIVEPEAKFAAAVFQSILKGVVPVDKGMLRKSVKVKTSKGPRGFPKGESIAFGVIVGQTKPSKAQRTKGTKIAYYAGMQEMGYHVGGTKIKKGGLTVGYKQRTDRLGSKGVKFMPGRHFVKRTLKTYERPIRDHMEQKIVAGILAAMSRS